MSLEEKIGVCATGKGPFTRSELKEKINVSGKFYFIESINDSVKILLCEDPTANSSKLNKAKEKGIQLVKYEDFDFGEIPSTGSAPEEPKSLKSEKPAKKSATKKKGSKAQRKNEEEALRLEKMRVRVRKGLQKYESLPKEYTNSIGMEFVLIPPGEYVREEGDPPVFITEPFYMGKYPVSQGEWLRVVEDNFPILGLGYLEQFPQEVIDWQDVLGYIIILESKLEKSYDLPTTKEWEYAASAGQIGFFNERNKSMDLGEYAWTKENSGGLAHSVGVKQPNPWGLHDFFGTVWEVSMHITEYEFAFRYQGGSRNSEHKDLLTTKDSTPKGEACGFRLVLKDLEISDEEFRLSEERRKRRRDFQFIQEWRESAEQRKNEFEKLPKEYINSRGMEFVLIPSGEYLMTESNLSLFKREYDAQTDLAENEFLPQLRVILTKPFYMGKYPITQREWVEIMGENPSKFKSVGEKAPIESISKEDCRKFIEKLNERDKKTYRLPTEAEWEFAARGGSTGLPSNGLENPLTIFTYGDDPSVLGDYAWYRKNSNNTTHPVGEKKPNNWGLYDMMGNVRQYCEGYYSRGSSFYAISENMNLSYHVLINSDERSERHGLRIVLPDLKFSDLELNLNLERIENKRVEVERKKIEEEKKWSDALEESRKVYENLPKEYINSLGMEFVLIPAGEFLMGAVPQDKEAYAEKPQHKVRITKPFYIGKYPVTQGEWRSLMGNNPSEFKKAGYSVGFSFKKAPVESVSWDDCQEYIKALNQKEGTTYRLPTEAEWEYAARGGLKGSDTGLYLYTYGDDPSVLGDYAWYRENSNNTTHPVGEKKPNNWGLYDMMGNVKEYCEGYLSRGSSFYAISENMNLSYRELINSDEKRSERGLRIVLPDLKFSDQEMSLNLERIENKRIEVERKKIEEEKNRLEEERKWNDALEESRKVYENLPKEYVNSLGMEFVLIPPGEFLMGAVPQDKEASDNEKPQTKVRITKPFYIGKYPITQDEWEGLMGNNPSKFKEAGKRAPVDSVSWDDCQEYIKTLNQKEGKTYRLPTEAEWEYSARGGSKDSETGSYIYTYGDDPSELDDYAWYKDNSNDTTHPVGQKKPNPIGLYDMMGNVWEWCEDWYDDKYYKKSPLYDPKGAIKGESRSLRGGSWGHDARYSRLSRRDNRTPDIRSSNRGFRLVLLP